MEEVTAHKVRWNLYSTVEEAEYAELKQEFKPIFKEIDYKFKGVNGFYKFFEETSCL